MYEDVIHNEENIYHVEIWIEKARTESKDGKPPSRRS